MSIECFKKFWKHVVFSRNIRVWWDNKYHSARKTHCSLPPILSPLLWRLCGPFSESDFFVRQTHFHCDSLEPWGGILTTMDGEGQQTPSDPPAPSLSFAFSILDTIGMANHLDEIYPQTENNIGSRKWLQPAIDRYISNEQTPNVLLSWCSCLSFDDCFVDH